MRPAGVLRPVRGATGNKLAFVFWLAARMIGLVPAGIVRLPGGLCGLWQAVEIQNDAGGKRFRSQFGQRRAAMGALQDIGPLVVMNDDQRADLAAFLDPSSKS